MPKLKPADLCLQLFPSAVKVRPKSAVELRSQTMKKPADKLTESDFRKWPVWEFCNDDTPDETAMSPVKKIPVDHLDSRVIGCEIKLANSALVFGALVLWGILMCVTHALHSRICC